MKQQKEMWVVEEICFDESFFYLYDDPKKADVAYDVIVKHLGDFDQLSNFKRDFYLSFTPDPKELEGCFYKSEIKRYGEVLNFDSVASLANYVRENNILLHAEW